MTKRESNIAKGMAIIFMYLHHLFGREKLWTSQGVETWLIPKGIFIEISMALKICVSIFVFITAYGISRSLKARVDSGKENMNQYMISRLVKLLSGFWFIYILARLTGFMGRSAGEIYGEPSLQRVGYVLLDFFGLAELSGTPTFCATWWYMSLAIVLIFLIPILRCIRGRLGGIVLILSVLLLPAALGWDGENGIDLYDYLLTCALGIMAAEGNWFERLRDFANGRKGGGLLMAFLSVFIFCAALAVRIKAGAALFFLTDAVIAAATCLFAAFALSGLKGPGWGLEKLGEHSMNLFLTHTFIKAYYFKEFTYSWKYPLFILLVLLAVTMLLSVIIEGVKKAVRYDKGVDVICRKLKGVLAADAGNKRRFVYGHGQKR